MEDLRKPDQIKKLEQSDLLDQLAEYTTTFTKLLFLKKKDGNYHHTKQMIKLLSAEIEARKRMEINHRSAGEEQDKIVV